MSFFQVQELRQELLILLGLVDEPANSLGPNPVATGYILLQLLLDHYLVDDFDLFIGL